MYLNGSTFSLAELEFANEEYYLKQKKIMDFGDKNHLAAEMEMKPGRVAQLFGK